MAANSGRAYDSRNPQLGGSAQPGDPPDGQHREQPNEPWTPRERGAEADGEKRQESQNWNHRDILRKQHAERPPFGRVEC